MPHAAGSHVQPAEANIAMIPDDGCLLNLSNSGDLLKVWSSPQYSLATGARLAKKLTCKPKVEQHEVGGVYLSVKHTAQTNLQLVANSSCRLAAVMHDLDHTVVLQNLLQTADESCLDRAVICHHVKDEADRGSIHLHLFSRVRVMMLLANHQTIRMSDYTASCLATTLSKIGHIC